MLIRDGVHLGWCPFGMVSIRDGVHSGWCPFGIVSFRIMSFRMVSIQAIVQIPFVTKCCSSVKGEPDKITRVWMFCLPFKPHWLKINWQGYLPKIRLASWFLLRRKLPYILLCKAWFTRTTTASWMERDISLFSCSRATLLTWSAQRRYSTTRG